MRIAYLSGDLLLFTAQRQEDGVHAGPDRASDSISGLKSCVLLEAWKATPGRPGTSTISQSQNRPHTVLVIDDILAVALEKHVSGAGAVIPMEDISQTLSFNNSCSPGSPRRPHIRGCKFHQLEGVKA